MFKKQGTSKRSASTSSCDIKPGFGEATPTDMGSQASACDMAWASEELLELDEVQLATVVGGVIPRDEWRRVTVRQSRDGWGWVTVIEGNWYGKDVGIGG